MTRSEIVVNFKADESGSDLHVGMFVDPGICLLLPSIIIPSEIHLKIYVRISPLHDVTRSCWCWHAELPSAGWERGSKIKIKGDRAQWENDSGAIIPIELESVIRYAYEAQYRFEIGLFNMLTGDRIWGDQRDRFILDRLAGSDFIRVLDAQHLNAASISYAENKNFNLLGVMRGTNIMNRIKHYINPESCRVLDLGCATGGPACAFAQTGAWVVGIDPDAVSLELSALRAKSELVQIRLVRGSGYDLPLRSACLDGVIMADVFEHVPEPKRILLEIQRVLVPGGFLYISAPNRISIRTIRREPHYGLPGIVLMPRRLAAWWVMRVKKTSSHYELYTVPTYWTMLHLLRSCGFRIDESLPFEEATNWMITNPIFRRLIAWLQQIRLTRLLVNKYVARIILAVRHPDVEMMAFRS